MLIHQGHTLTRFVLAWIQSLSSAFPNNELLFLLPCPPPPPCRLRFLEEGGNSGLPLLIFLKYLVVDPILQLAPPAELKTSEPPASTFDFLILQEAPPPVVVGLAAAADASDVVKEGGRKTTPRLKVGGTFNPPPTVMLISFVSRQVKEQEDEASVKGGRYGKAVVVAAEPPSLSPFVSL